VAAAQVSSVITITGRSTANASVSGFGDAPLARAPLQAAVITTASLADSGVQQLSGLTRLDASVADAYNAEGYWSNLAVRGFTLDNRFNYRRDGLPINAETALGLENKDRIELLKGTSGVQAGTSSPGGLVNLVVKRANVNTKTLHIEAREAGTLLAAADLGQRFGADSALGVRINLVAEKLSPKVRDTAGQRHLGAIAFDWQATPDTLLQAEAETSHQKQPSVVGYSLLGNQVPNAKTTDTLRNLNQQPWGQPVVLDGTTASIKLQQRLGDNWRVTAHAMQQRLKSDDRTAFPYGVYDANYACSDYCDRFAPDGSFTYWQYISNNEHRTSSSATVYASASLGTGAVKHSVEWGVLRSRYSGQFQDQVFDIAGTGNINGTQQTPPAPGFADANTNRRETSTEWFVRDAINFGVSWQVWAGLRHSQLQREAQRTSADNDGSLRATKLKRSATSPWLALAYTLTDKTTAYASWGKGLEVDVSPNLPRYANRGEALPIHSQQWELGLKHGTNKVEAALTVFNIERDRSTDLGPCDTLGSCKRVVDGYQHHRGLEAQWAQQLGNWSFQSSAMWLRAQQAGASQSGVNGLSPANVPSKTLRLGSEYRPPQLQGLALLANLSAEGSKSVLPYDEQTRIGGWARLDLAASWQQQLAGPAGATTVTWRVGVDNASNRRAWKEAPYQFGHAYLYPLAPRTWRFSMQAAL
jgi:iron complex outermembrane recepter protein